MGKKTIYEQYEDAIKQFDERIDREGYKARNYRKLQKKRGKDGKIEMMEILTGEQQVEGMCYENDGDSIAFGIGGMYGTYDAKKSSATELEKFVIIYKKDGKMNISYFPEVCIEKRGVSKEKLQELAISEQCRVMKKIAGGIPSMSIEAVMESDLTDGLDPDTINKLEKLWSIFKFDAPELDIGVQREDMFRRNIINIKWPNEGSEILETGKYTYKGKKYDMGLLERLCERLISEIESGEEGNYPEEVLTLAIQMRKKAHEAILRDTQKTPEKESKKSKLDEQAVDLNRRGILVTPSYINRSPEIYIAALEEELNKQRQIDLVKAKEMQDSLAKLTVKGE